MAETMPEEDDFLRFEGEGEEDEDGGVNTGDEEDTW